MKIINSGWDDEVFRMVSGIISRKFKERGAQLCPDDNETELNLIHDPSVEGEAYILSVTSGLYRIAASKTIGLINGTGDFLDRGNIKGGRFIPSPVSLTKNPGKAIRCVYFATHFFNFYHVAPLEDIYPLIEDYALWGANSIQVWYDMHHYKNPRDDESIELILRLKSILAHASKLGMQTIMVLLANEAFKDSPKELRATWQPRGKYTGALAGHYHVEICPSKPGGLEQILAYRKDMLEVFSKTGPSVTIDYFGYGPYDQGGCTCEECEPWGTNGFLRIGHDIVSLLKKYYPNSKIILSTWRFNIFIKGELEGLYERLDSPSEDFSWIDIVLADLEDPVIVDIINSKKHNPGGRPLLGFPEISMWGQVPWGGYGSNATPVRLEERWNQIKEACSGGTMYSEGLYEDINKKIMLSFYSERYDSVSEIIREYCRSEFGEQFAGEISEIIMLQEKALMRHQRDIYGEIHDYYTFEGFVWPSDPRYVIENTEHIANIYKKVMELHERLPVRVRMSWRWDLIYLRSIIDYELLRNNFLPTERCFDCFERLRSIYRLDKRAEDCLRPLYRNIKWNMGTSAV
jgi:hypothetical protein